MKKYLLPILTIASVLILSGCVNTNLPSETSFSDDIESSEPAESDPVSEESDSEEAVSQEQSEEESEPEESQSETTPVEYEDKYTILVYLCGSNLESGYDPETKQTDTENAGLATANIKEMLSINYPSNVNVVIQTGGAKTWANSGFGIRADKLGRWHIANKKLVNDAQLTRASMGSSTTFQSFIEWGLETYPADKVGVVMWNHGSATDGCCQDENYGGEYGDLLTPAEYRTALTNAMNNTSYKNKLEWIGYDCCLMQYQDLAAFNSNYFKYMIASQETEPGDGWDYDGWLDDIASNPTISTPTLLQEVADTYKQKCLDINNEYADWIEYLISSGEWKDYQEEGYTLQDFQEMAAEYRDFNDATLSVLDLSKMNAYVDAWESMVSALSIKSTSNWNSLANIIKKSQQFGYYDDEYGYAYDIYDVDDFLNNLKKSSNSTFKNAGADKVLTALNNLVIYNAVGKDSAGACGLCFYACINGWVVLKNISFTPFTNWYNINNTYGNH